jgi:hypothetical protein
MLKIKNIQRIMGLYANGRQIIEAGDYRDVLRQNGKDYFVFKIEAIGDYTDYCKEHDIVLSKIPELNGKYRMFNMGLQLVTEIEVSMDEIRIPSELCIRIRNILVKTQTFYQQNK